MEHSVIKKLAMQHRELRQTFGIDYFIACAFLILFFVRFAVDLIRLIQGHTPNSHFIPFLPEIGLLGFGLLLFIGFKHEMKKGEQKPTQYHSIQDRT